MQLFATLEKLDLKSDGLFYTMKKTRILVKGFFYISNHSFTYFGKDLAYPHFYQ